MMLFKRRNKRDKVVGTKLVAYLDGMGVLLNDANNVFKTYKYAVEAVLSNRTRL
jgi:hypothetical protein